MTPPVIYSIDTDGIAWVTFDDPSSKANVFKREVLACFKDLIQSLSKESALKAVIIQSAKENIFIAGADIRWMKSLDSTQAAYTFAREGQSLMESLAHLHVPVIAAIHGACAGGGYELALACHYRIASDSPKTLIGLPEVTLGIIPGWGGCVRLPRLIGTKAALDHILKAQLLSAPEAKKAGLVEELVAPHSLKEAARVAANRLITQFVSTPPPSPSDDGLFETVRKQTFKRTRGHQPAPLIAISTLEKSWNMPIEKALEIEAHGFAELVVTPECKNLMHVFCLRDANKKAGVEAWFPSTPPPSQKPPTIQRIGIIGAGIMGSGIAQWCSSRGYDIYLHDVSPEFVDRGIKKVEALFQEGVKRGKQTSEQARQGMSRVHGTANWKGFNSCDLVIEAVVEDIQIKRPVFEHLSRILSPHAILATNTSSIPIDKIAKKVTSAVVQSGNQAPKFGKIKDLEDEGGTFFFIKK